MTGHAFLECQTCAPSTYFLALFVREPSPLVLCYAISQATYEEWTRSDEATPPTGELLHRLRDPQGRSHHPDYHPPR